MALERLVLACLLLGSIFVSGCGSATVGIAAIPETGTLYAQGANDILDDFRSLNQHDIDQNKILDLSGFADEFKDSSDINTLASMSYILVQPQHYIESDSNTGGWVGTGTNSAKLGDA